MSILTQTKPNATEAQQSDRGVGFGQCQGVAIEPSLEEINAMLADAERDDRRLREIPKTRGFQRWNTYKAGLLKNISLALGHRVFSPGEELTEKEIVNSIGKPYTYSDEYPLENEGLSPDDFPEERLEMQAMAYSYETEAECLTMLGVLNNLLYHAAQSFGVFEWEDGRIVGGDRAAAARMMRTPTVMVTALQHTTDYMKSAWKKCGAWYGRVKVSASIAELRDCELLSYESHFEAGTYATSRMYKDMEIAKMLFLAEALQERLGFDALPHHGMMAVVTLYNTIFTGWGFGRKGEFDTAAAPDTWEETDQWREARKKIKREPAPAFVQVKDQVLEGLIETWRSLREMFGFEDGRTAEAYAAIGHYNSQRLVLDGG